MVNGDIVLVTGAGSGIGLEISKAFAEAGAKVVITDVNTEAAETAAKSLQEAGHDVIGLTLNVTDEAQVQSVFAETIKQYGRLDVLINNAGLQHVSPIEDFPTEKFELMIKIMLTAPFIAIKHAFPLMKEQGYGRIINMASINGLIGFAGKAAYNSAKHGLLGLTKVAALEGRNTASPSMRYARVTSIHRSSAIRWRILRRHARSNWKKSSKTSSIRSFRKNGYLRSRKSRIMRYSSRAVKQKGLRVRPTS